MISLRDISVSERKEEEKREQKYTSQSLTVGEPWGKQSWIVSTSRVPGKLVRSV